MKKKANEELKDVKWRDCYVFRFKKFNECKKFFGGTSSMQTENQIKYFERVKNK